MQNARDHAELCKQVTPERSLLKAALAQDIANLQEQLLTEERTEKAIDREYWEPLRMELERWNWSDGDVNETSETVGILFCIQQLRRTNTRFMASNTLSRFLPISSARKRKTI